MKLKKLMALALSGAMAVSMMTACGGSGNGGTPNGGEGEGVVTGYSSVLAKYMEDTSKKDYFTFQDDAAEAAALADALGNRGTLLLSANTVAPVVLPVTSPVIANDFKNSLGLDVVVTDVVNGVLGDWVEILRLFGSETQDGLDGLIGTVVDVDTTNIDFADEVNKTKKVGMIFVADGTISVEKALKQIADGVSSYINDIELGDWDTENPLIPVIENGANKVVKILSLDTIASEYLPESKTSDAGETYEYNYKISASVVNKALTVFDGYNGSANFIAVTITRTVK